MYGIYVYPIGSMYGIYANIWGIWMGSMLPYIAYMDPMGYGNSVFYMFRQNGYRSLAHLHCTAGEQLVTTRQCGESLCRHSGKTKIKNATRAAMSDGTEKSLRWSMRYPTFNSGSSGSNKSREWHAQLLAYLTRGVIEHCLSFGKRALGADQNQISPDQNKDSYLIICFVSICFGSIQVWNC